MANWVRLWEDMPTDPKWRVIAKRAGRPIAEVMAVFMFMMTNAGANATERGELSNWSDEDVAAALDVETQAVTAIREAMQGKTLEGDRLSGWEKRQPKREDGAAERAKQWRERNRTQPNARKRPEADAETDNTHTAREPSEAENYGSKIRDTFTIARVACPDLNPSIAWRKAGWPVEIVCETIRAKLEAIGTQRVRSLNYFENAIADAVARSNAPVPIGSANQRAGPSAPREKPMGAAAAILQRDREKSRNERHYAETQPVVIDALPIASGAR